MKKEIPLWAKTGHGKPITRRDMLASGLMTFSGSMFLPAITQFIGSRAQAATCAPLEPPSLMPFVTLNLAGGAGLCANVVPFDQGGQALKTYNKMGMGDRPSLMTEFGKVPFFSKSQLLAGLKMTAKPETLANTALVSLCVQAKDDTRDNRFDISRVVQLAGRRGTLLPNLGIVNTGTGINQNFSMLEPETPLVVNSFNDIKNSLSYSGGLLAMKPEQKSALGKLLSRLTASQSQKLKEDSSQGNFADLIACSSIQNSQLIQQQGGDIDPRNNAEVATAWGLNAASNPAANEFKFASMLYSSIKGNAGVVNVELGGYDYHDQTRTTGSAKDLDAGKYIGRILETARIMNSPIFLYVTSDGSVVSTVSSDDQSPWVSDRGSAGMALMIVYSPKGRPNTKSFQLGHFTPDQAAADSTPFGANPEKAAATVFLNYLVASGKPDLFDSIARGVFDPKFVTDLTIFT